MAEYARKVARDLTPRHTRLREPCPLGQPGSGHRPGPGPGGLHLPDQAQDGPGAAPALGLAVAGGVDLARPVRALAHGVRELRLGERVAEADNHAFLFPPARPV